MQAKNESAKFLEVLRDCQSDDNKVYLLKNICAGGYKFRGTKGG